MMMIVDVVANCSHYHAMVSAGARLTEVDKAHRSAMHFAVQGNQSSLLSELYMDGFDLNAKDSNGRTPIYRCHAPTPVRRCNATQPRPLMILIEIRWVDCSHSCLEELLSLRADVNAVDSDGRTPIFFAALAYVTELRSRQRLPKCIHFG